MIRTLLTTNDTLFSSILYRIPGICRRCSSAGRRGANNNAAAQAAVANIMRQSLEIQQRAARRNQHNNNHVIGGMTLEDRRSLLENWLVTKVCVK